MQAVLCSASVSSLLTQPVVYFVGVYIPILPNDERYTAILDAPVPFMVGLPFDTRSSATSVDLSNNDGL